METARPIGLALSRDLLDRLDAIARAARVSRSSVARSFLVKGLAAYERWGGAREAISALGSRGGRYAAAKWRDGLRADVGGV